MNSSEEVNNDIELEKNKTELNIQLGSNNTPVIQVNKFIEHIKDVKPDWYTKNQNKNISLAEIKLYYKEFSNTTLKNNDVYHTELFKRLLSYKNVRWSNGWMLTLKKYEDLNIYEEFENTDQLNQQDINFDTQVDQHVDTQVSQQFQDGNDNMVYFIMAYDFKYADWQTALSIEKTMYVKIGGTTRTIKERIKNLQTGCPLKMECIKQILLNYDYHVLESILHDKYRKIWITREWFRFTIKEINEILQMK